MTRREFMRTCMAGAAVGSVSLLPVTATALEQRKGVIDGTELAKTAYEYFIGGKRTCCESILMAGCEVLGIESDLVPDIALGLAGGGGLQGKNCGILTGGSLVLSLAVAQRQTEYPKKKKATFGAVGRFYKAFEKQVGSIECRTLCKLDLTTPEGRSKLEGGVKEQVCTGFLQIGSELLAKELQTISAESDQP